MKTLNGLIPILMVGLVLGLAVPAQAALIDRGLFDTDGVPGGPTVRLIYDDDRNITWLGDANFAKTSGFSGEGLMNWNTAEAWASSLTVGGFTNWRLPTALNADGSGPCSGFNCIGSELGHIFYTELGNVSFSPGCTLQVNCGLVNTGPFSNVSSDPVGGYWFETERSGALPFSDAWLFNMGRDSTFVGNQAFNSKFALTGGWAVRDGDVGATSLLGIEVDGCVTAAGGGTPCAIPPVFPISFTELTATVVDPGVEFTQLAGNFTADFDDTSVTLTALGGVFDLQFVFASNDWILQNVALRPGGNLGVISITLDSASNSFEVITEDTIGENFLHTATFDITAETKSSQPTNTGDSFLQGGGNKNFNEGANHVLVVEKKGTKRTVVDFDLSTITTQVVSNARLVLTLERPTQDWGTTGGTVDAHRLTAPFTEGDGFTWEQTLGLGDRGTGSGVTWNCASDTDISNKKTDCESRWKGGSQASESVTDSAVITNGQTGEVSWDVTVDVQAALTEQATAIQWLIRKTREHGKGQAVFYSKEGAVDLGDVTKAPRLELEFVD